MALRDHEINYVYRNSELRNKPYTVIKGFFGGDLLYDYLVCSIDELYEEGIIVGLMSTPTADSMEWEQEGNQRLCEGGNATLMFQKVFTKQQERTGGRVRVSHCNNRPTNLPNPMFDFVFAVIISVGGLSSYAATGLLVAWLAAAGVKASGSDWIWISLYSAFWIVTVPAHFAGALIYAFYTDA